jgi:hypothetical protein
MGFRWYISAKTHLFGQRAVHPNLDCASLPDAPEVDRRCVPFLTQEKFRWSIPSRDDTVRVITFGESSTPARHWNGFVKYSCKTKVGNAKYTAVIDQKVGS